MGSTLRKLFEENPVDLTTCGSRSFGNCPLRKLADATGFVPVCGDWTTGHQVVEWLRGLGVVHWQLFTESWDGFGREEKEEPLQLRLENALQWAEERSPDEPDRDL